MKKKTGINLTKEVKGLYAENYKILIKNSGNTAIKILVWKKAQKSRGNIQMRQ